MTVDLNSNSDADTRAIGRRLSGLLQAGDVVVLCGSLGAGKTALVGGVADGLGIDEQVTSPSFVLMKKYVSGFIPLVHVDVYRIGSLGEFDDLEVYEESRNSVLVIEWGDAVAANLPDDHLRVEIEITGETDRIVRLDGQGNWKARRLEGMSS